MRLRKAMGCEVPDESQRTLWLRSDVAAQDVQGVAMELTAGCPLAVGIVQRKSPQKKRV
jgi:hypothetical protein